MGCSQNYEPLLVLDYITAPNIYDYQNGTLILGTTHMDSPTFGLEGPEFGSGDLAIYWVLPPPSNSLY